MILLWKYALSSEWTRSLEHWLETGQHYLDKYKCWGILTLSPFPKSGLHCDQRRSAKSFWDNFKLEAIVNCPLASVERRSWSLSSNGHCAQLKDIIKAILTFFSSFGCFFFFGSLYFEMLNWPSRAPLNTSAIIKAGQAIDWTPVNSAPLHILSSPFSVSHKVLNASSSLPELSAVRGHYLHVSLARPSAPAVWERGMGGRWGRWGRTSKCVQFRTWAGMIKNCDCLHCTSHMGPLLPLPLDFLPILPIFEDEITAWPVLLGAPRCFTLLEVLLHIVLLLSLDFVVWELFIG